MIPVPWWTPALWVGAGILLFQDHLAVTLLGYHALCLLGSLGTRPRLGRMPAWGLALLAAGAALLPLVPRLAALPFLPSAPIRELRAHLPGGLVGFTVYSLLVNVPLEEAYWRSALPGRRPGWGIWRLGLAFGLHHGVACALRFGPLWGLAALAATGAAGALWSAWARRLGGLALPLAFHALSDLALILLILPN